VPHKKLSRNAPCPCGSGKRYGACCWDKGFEWVEDEAGTVYRSTPMSPEVREALEQLRQAFVARHGTPPSRSTRGRSASRMGDRGKVAHEGAAFPWA
jgi:hypothetical protein